MFEKIIQHVGHNLEAVTYGNSDLVMNAAIECLDCGEVVVDEDSPAITDDGIGPNRVGI